MFRTDVCVSSVSLIVLKSKTLISPGLGGKRLSYSAGESLHRIPTGCNSPREEWRRWRRWIVGYAVVCACIKDFYLAASVSSVYFHAVGCALWRWDLSHYLV